MSWGKYTDLKVIREMLAGALKTLIDWLDGGAVWRVEASTADLKVYYRALRCYAGGTWYSIAAGAVSLGSAPTSDIDYFVYVSTAGAVTVAAADPGGGTFRLAKVHTPAGTLPASLTAINEGLSSDQRALLTAPGGSGGGITRIVDLNAAQVSVGTGQTTLFNLSFELSAQDNIVIDLDVTMQAAAALTATGKWYLDGNQAGNVPEQYCTAAGKWHLNVNTVLLGLAAGAHTLQFRINTSASTLTIAVEQAMIHLWAEKIIGGIPVTSPVWSGSAAFGVGVSDVGAAITTISMTLLGDPAESLGVTISETAAFSTY